MPSPPRQVLVRPMTGERDGVLSLEGVPDHRDSILDEEDRAANETMMICVSRVRSPRLVLDL